jgi:lysozyme
MARTINDAGLQLITSSEGLRLQAYQDIAGIWTIGYGHTGGVQPGMNITAAQATQFLMQDLATIEGQIASATADVPTTDNQFAAMVSLGFNIGWGNFKTSSVLRFHLAQQPANAATAFDLWDKAHVDGQLVEVPGLLARRQREAALYRTP